MIINLKYLDGIGYEYPNEVINVDEDLFGHDEDSIKEFAKNLPIKVIRGGLAGEDLAKFKANYNYYKDKYKKSKYNAVDNNCEHYVNEVIFGVHQSMQSDFTKEMVK
jgi:hypothetical protein